MARKESKIICGVDTSKRPLRIAVVGSDGSGKTTVVDHLMENLAPNYSIDRLKALARPQSKNPVINKIGFSLRALSNKGDELRFPRLIALAHFTHGFLLPFLRIAKEKDKEIVLFERHPLIDAEVYKPDYAGSIIGLLGPGITGAVPPDLIIYSHCSPEVAYKRILQRVGGKGNPKQVAHLHERLDYLPIVNKRFDNAVGKLSKKHNIPVIRLDTDNAEKNSKQITMKLRTELNKLGLEY